jgi:hypothetical protein
VTNTRFPGTPDPSTTGTWRPDRRSVTAGLVALLAIPGATVSGPAIAATGDSWTMATQIIAGARLADPNVLDLAVKALEGEVGADVVRRLYFAILERDAASIVDPFEDEKVEAAARRFVEMIYTGEIAPGTIAAFHQALAWQVLPFTKPPSVCGPGMGWWTDPPQQSG